MIRTEGKKIIMDKGDYGLPVPFRFINNRGQVLETDEIKLEIKSYGDVVIEKNYTNLDTESNGYLYFVFELTKEDSEKLIEDDYVYSVQVYRDGELLNTLINNELIIME